MAVTEQKTIRCRRCKSDFEPIYRNGIILSRLCLPCLSAKAKQKVRKDHFRQTKEMKQQLKTKSNWLNDLQKVFNEYIRLRDRNKPCISCGKKLIGKYDAGHYFTVGAYPNLRFYEDNVHGQCVECNQHKHGNISEYSLRLPNRIGQDCFNKLLEERNKLLNITIPEIQENIKYYKEKIKQLKQD